MYWPLVLRPCTNYTYDKHSIFSFSSDSLHSSLGKFSHTRGRALELSMQTGGYVCNVHECQWQVYHAWMYRECLLNVQTAGTKAVLAHSTCNSWFLYSSFLIPLLGKFSMLVKWRYSCTCMYTINAHSTCIYIRVQVCTHMHVHTYMHT